MFKEDSSSKKRLTERIGIYLRLIRLRTTLTTFVQLPVGFFLVKHTFERQDLTTLLQYLIILGILLYGALYTFNNIIDYASDKRSKIKTRRPLARGQLSINSAWIVFSSHVLLVMAALAFYRFPPLLSGAALFLAAINVFYTLFAKKVPYLELITASTTYPTRTAIGILLAGGALTSFAPFLTVNYLATVTLNVIKRMGEKEFDRQEVRPVLASYPGKTLGIIAIGSCALTISLIPFLREDGWQLFFGVFLALLQLFFFTTYLLSSRGDRPKLMQFWQ